MTHVPADDAYGERPPLGEALPLLVSIPHTGTQVPPAVAARFADASIAGLPMTDWHLHALYDFLPELGATTLFARWSRFVVDLNRAPDGAPLYPGRFETGLVPLETFHGEPIFTEPPTAGETERLRARYHQPYHERLGVLLDEARARWGRVVLVDAHSVASVANRIHGALEEDVYLGDRDGKTCGAWLRETLAEGFAGEGLRVVANRPYKGGYITAHYGARPDVEAIQIEMCQRVYMDEARPAGATETARFGTARAMLRRVFERLVSRLA
jgi:N-formylglutamate deformylase